MSKNKYTCEYKCFMCRVYHVNYMISRPDEERDLRRETRIVLFSKTFYARILILCLNILALAKVSKLSTGETQMIYARRRG